MRLILMVLTLVYSFGAGAGEEWIMFKWTRDPEHRELHEFYYANGQAMYLIRIEDTEMTSAEYVPKWKIRDVDEKEARLIAESLSVLVSKSKNDKRNIEDKNSTRHCSGLQWAAGINSLGEDVEYSNRCDRLIKFEDLESFVGSIFRKSQGAASQDRKQ